MVGNIYHLSLVFENNIYHLSLASEDTLYFRILFIEVIVTLACKWDQMISDAKAFWGILLVLHLKLSILKNFLNPQLQI